MYQVKGLEDYGSWCKKGEIYTISNNRAEHLSRRKIVEIIKFVGHYPYSPYHLKQSIKSMRLQIENLQRKIKAYEEILEKGE